MIITKLARWKNYGNTAIPMGYRVIGGICNDDGSNPGALVYNGRHCHLAFNQLTELDETQVAFALARMRVEPTAKRKRLHSLSITDELFDELCLIGSGNFTEGVRIVTAAYKS